MGNISRRNLLTAATAASGTVALGVLGVAAAAQAPTTAQQRPRVDHYTTGPNAELVPAITRVTRVPYKFTTLYSLKLPDLKAGDVVQAHGQFEVTNDLGFNVMIAHAMLVHRAESIVVH